MSMRRLFFGFMAAAVGIVASAASATDDPIATRKQLMQSNGAAAGVATGMIKGEIAFDPKVAMAALQAFEATGYAFGDYFPEGSHEGETRASPKIWEEMEEFQEYVADLREAAAQGVAAKPESVEALQTAMGPIGDACKECHEEFREEE
jgi:cytochrome c556